MKFLRCALVFLLLCALWFQATAYKQSDFLKKKAEYSLMLEKKVSARLDGFSAAKLKRLDALIMQAIDKFEESTSISDNQKLIKLSLLYAFQELVTEKIETPILTITIIDDKRCTDCYTDNFTQQLENTPYLSGATFVFKNFSDEWVSDYLIANNIALLPAIILSTNTLNDEGAMTPYLDVINSGEYSLQVGAKFDPFLERTERGFLLLNSEMVTELNKDAYIDGSTNADITIYEFSDLECPFCARVHNTGTLDELKTKYRNKLNIVFKHFPLDFHPNAKTAAEVLECTGEELGTATYYNLIDEIFSLDQIDAAAVVNAAIDMWVDSAELDTCLKEERFSAMIDAQYAYANTNLGITWTPAFLIVNNSTSEYEILGGAYPFDNFVDIVDRLLK